MVKCPACKAGNWLEIRNHCKERIYKMAKCNTCGKTTNFGHSRSFSLRATNRKFKANLQKVTVMEQGRLVKKTLCTKCIKTLAKSTT